MSSLPRQSLTDSGQLVREFYDRYYTAKIEYPANEVDAVLQFFEKRGFESASAANVTTVLMQQAKVDGVKTFKLLDTLDGLTEVQLSALVAEILNYNRTKSSTLGYRIQSQTNPIESRNIDGIDNVAGIVDDIEFVDTGYVTPGYIVQES